MVVCFIDIPVTHRRDGRSSTESIAVTAAIRLGNQRECHSELISVGDGSGNWCGIVLEGGGHYLVRDGGHWPQMSETEQICAVKRGKKLRPCWE
jgi:hypothetical protein